MKTRTTNTAPFDAERARLKKLGAPGKICRWCAAPLSGRLTSWCSKACSAEYWIRNSSPRPFVMARDHGVCAACGFDTKRITRLSRRLRFGVSPHRIYEMRYQASNGHGPVQHVLDHFDLVVRWRNYFKDVRPTYLHPCHAWRRFLVVADRHGWDTNRLGQFSDPWDADHVIEVHEGGGACGLDNYQTLCLLCHKAKTARKRVIAAAARRAPQDDCGQLEIF